MADNPDDPFAPQDGTILRPQPGAGRRAGTPGQVSGSGSASPFPQPSHGPSISIGQAPGGTSQSLADFVGGSGNPILQAAAPLLILAAKLQTSVQQANINTLRQQAVHEIRALEQRLSRAGVPAEDVLVARYVLCTFVDSAVSNTPWGAPGRMVRPVAARHVPQGSVRR